MSSCLCTHAEKPLKRAACAGMIRPMNDEPADAPFGPVLRYLDRVKERYEAPSPRLSGAEGWIAAAVPDLYNATPGLLGAFRFRERMVMERTRRATALGKWERLRDDRGEWQRGENESDQALCLKACLAAGKIFKKEDRAADYITQACMEARPRRYDLLPRRTGLKVPPRIPIDS